MFRINYIHMCLLKCKVKCMRTKTYIYIYLYIHKKRDGVLSYFFLYFESLIILDKSIWILAPNFYITFLTYKNNTLTHLPRYNISIYIFIQPVMNYTVPCAVKSGIRSGVPPILEESKV